MSAHTGVSCDACMKANFAGRRYKCLLCDNYDLCGGCFDVEAESQNHTNSHPMQCILTKTAYELFYAGESIAYRTIVSLTCPYCGLSGFIPRTLLTHCVEKHPSLPSNNNKNSQVVICPICVVAPTQGHRSRVVSLADHIATMHDDGQGGEDDAESVPPITHVRHGEDEEEDSDPDEDDDDDEEPPLNDPEHRAFIEEEHRRQEAARQRLAHASSLAAASRNDYAAALNGNAATQRRPLTRQTAIRSNRGSIRGHFNDFPYGAALRSTTGFSSGTTLRCPPDATTTTASSTDPYSAAIFAQDPMLEFVSRLVNSQQQSSSSSTTSTTNVSSNGPFLFAPSIPVHIPPPNATAAELARLQQQIENNDRMIQIKSTLLQSKQRRSNQVAAQQQQQQGSAATAQPVTLTHPSGLDYQLWQQQYQQQFPAFPNLNFLTGTIPTDSTSTLVHSSKNNQQSQREIDPRSLLGKILRSDRGACGNESNDIRLHKQVDHFSFIQSILLSSIGTRHNSEFQEEEMISNENPPPLPPPIQSDIGKENTL